MFIYMQDLLLMTLETCLELIIVRSGSNYIKIPKGILGYLMTMFSMFYPSKIINNINLFTLKTIQLVQSINYME